MYYTVGDCWQQPLVSESFQMTTFWVSANSIPPTVTCVSITLKVVIHFLSKGLRLEGSSHCRLETSGEHLCFPYGTRAYRRLLTELSAHRITVLPLRGQIWTFPLLHCLLRGHCPTAIMQRGQWQMNVELSIATSTWNKHENIATQQKSITLIRDRH